MNPIVIQTGPVAVRWYGLLIRGGILATAFVADREARRPAEDTELLLCSRFNVAE